MQTRGLANYIANTRKLDNIDRWASEHCLHRRSVSEHSFGVAQIAQVLGIIEETNGNKVNWQKLFSKAINHDLKEAVTGDVLHETKHTEKALQDALKIVEQELVGKYILNEIFDSTYKEKINQILNDDKDDSTEGKILQAADTLDAMLECICEIHLNNLKPFKEKYLYLERHLDIDLISVRVFQKEILPVFREGIV